MRTLQEIAIVGVVLAMSAQIAYGEYPMLPTLPQLPRLPSVGNAPSYGARQAPSDDDMPNVPRVPGTVVEPSIPSAMPNGVYEGIDGCIHARVYGVDQIVRCP